MTEQETNETRTGLYWKDKREEVDRVVLPFQTIEVINESRATREKEKDTFIQESKNKKEPGWYNRLIWGDNKYIIASLLEEFAGKIDMIYIDPPFATGANFSVKMKVGDEKWTKEPSAIEEKAYRDTWGKGLDSYLQMMYDRLVLMRELLSDNGSIYIHLDWHVGHYLKIILDRIFGYENCLNEIIWYYRRWNIASRVFARSHDNILLYCKNYGDHTFNNLYIPKSEKSSAQGKAWKSVFDENGKRHSILTGEKTKGVPMPDAWEISILNPVSLERLGFPTQKPESLLDRIIKASSNEGDIVADLFCGSGTTGAVAEQLGRKWIMADLGRYAIHTTRKRMLDIDNCSPFIVQNLGKYERQYWQGITFGKKKDKDLPLYEYIEFILKLYHAEPISGMVHIHGKKGSRFIHVGSVDAPVTLSEIQDAIEELKQSQQNSLDVLGWEWEMGLHDVVEQTAKEHGVNLRTFYIPRDVMDPRAADKWDITFYELAYVECSVDKNKHDEYIIKLTDFAIPNLDLIPEDVRDKIKKWSDYIDYWAVDWNWQGDKFHNMWQSYRTKKEPQLGLKTDPYKFENTGEHRLLVKVIDVFGNDTTKVIELRN